MTLQIRNTDLDQLHEELHDLCQPLTALQCRLEMGRMLGHNDALLAAMDGCLDETQRIFEVIARMRHRLLNAEEIGS